MHSILVDEDKEIVYRMVPKATNKIQAVAVARLYVAYPDKSRWTFTGLQGAAVLANDLVGNTYWLKLVDISPAGRGVLWDQEIYDSWSYNQDRTFFHTFEMEECLAGLSFADEKEAKTFLKKMNDREKNASKATKENPFGASGNSGRQKHGILGGLFGGGHRHSSAPSIQPTPPDSPSIYIPPSHNDRSSLGSLSSPKPVSGFAILEAVDPNWRENWGDDLRTMGIDEDTIRHDQDFIADYIRQQQQKGAVSSQTTNGTEIQRSRPPAPPPSAASRTLSEAPSFLSTVTSASSQRGAPPAPPPSRRPLAASSQREATPPREPSPPRGPPPTRFAVPPPLPEAGTKLRSNAPSLPNRQRGSSVSNPGPPPPPRPPKTPNDDYEPGDTGSRFGVPPPFTGQRAHQVPPATPARGPVPAPPPRDTPPRGSVSHPQAHSVPPASFAPPLPPKMPHSGPSPAAPTSPRPIPPPPGRDSAPPPPPRDSGPPPPPLPPPTSRTNGAPIAPPLPPPSSGAPPPPPPPPPPGLSGPPAPPPPPPNRDSGYASGVPALPQPSGDRGDLMAGIKQAGGIGALKKVDRSQIRDRSAAAVPGGDTGPAGSGLPPAGATTGGGGLADALAQALNKRKQKVSASDDEGDGDDW